MKYIIFGAGQALENIFQVGLLEDDDIVAIVDNNVQKQGSLIRNGGREWTILNPSALLSLSFDAVLISVKKFKPHQDIIKQLQSYRIELTKICYEDGEKIYYYHNVVSKEMEVREPRIFYDVSVIKLCDFGTGIHRMVRSVYQEMNKNTDSVIPWQWFCNDFVTAWEYYFRVQNVPYSNNEQRINFLPKDVIFMADSSWEAVNEFLPDARIKDIETFTVLYDLIGVQHKECFLREWADGFKNWVDTVLCYTKNIICISRTVADELVRYYKHQRVERDIPLKVFTVHLGFDIKVRQGKPRQFIKSFLEQKKTFLVVGTVEIRKNHFLLLQAFSKLLSRYPQYSVQLLILGKDGWKNQEFKSVMEGNRIIRENVLWVQDASDDELQWAYKKAEALVFLSRAEGFGLPLIEAAYYGLPILCSDIPIFHEIVGTHATYVNIDNEDTVLEALLNWLNADYHPDSKEMPLFTWKQCAQEIIDIVEGVTTPYCILS